MIPIVKKILRPFLPRMTRWYLSKTRWYSAAGIRIKVYPGVFHPGLFFSTSVLLNYLTHKDLQGLRILELGAGSGFLSIFCSRRKAAVTASDISKTAIENLSENKFLTGAEFQIVESDLFDSMNPDDFDLIVINPPYYPRNPARESERAWYCGDDFQYFKKLFSQLREKQKKTNNTIVMVLSEDCDINKITSLAEREGYFSSSPEEVKNFWEKSFLFEWKKMA